MKSQASSSPPASPPSTSMQSRWTALYRHELPRLARARDGAQRHWPVHLDHCFARIILDAVVGGSAGAPWTAVLPSPAVRNMSAAQLQACIELAEAIADGSADLDALNERSLLVRGKSNMKEGGTGGSKRKKEGGGEKESGVTKKARTVGEQDSSTTAKAGLDRKSKSKSTQPSIRTAFGLPPSPSPSSSTTTSPSDLPKAAPIPTDIHALITTSAQLTPFRQRVLLHLCQIPRGHTSTYAALAAHMSSCPRAVGNALRNNPFAPRVPCHRVVASGGGIGGFAGEWGDAGAWCADKVGLLRAEGVDVAVVDRGKGRTGKKGMEGKGKEEGGGKLVVRGPVWEGFENVEI